MSDKLDKMITNVIEVEKNGVKVVIKQQYNKEINDINIDFSERDKVFEDKIASLENQIAHMKEKKNYLRTRCMEDATDAFDSGAYGKLTIVGRRVDLETEIEKLKQRIVKLEKSRSEWIDRAVEWQQKCEKLESKETENPTKINLNDRVKVKLTPLGAEIYYNRYDFLKSSVRAIGGVCTEPKMPKIDENGYTEMTMWQFIELYGKDIGKINREVIKPLDIIIAE